MTEAELAALAQRLQLDALQGALSRLESEVARLEEEADRQSAELKHLAEAIRQLRGGGSREPASDEAWVGQPSTDPSVGFVPPKPGESWESHLRDVDRRIADIGIEAVGDPLSQLMPPHLAAAVRCRFAKEFRSAAWDRWDVGAVVLAVLVGAATDYLLVATPGGSFKGKPQRESPLTTWMKEQSRKLAPRPGDDDVARNPFQAWVADLTTAAASWAKVPYDVVIPKLGLTPNVHRLASLAHDPLLGLVFGVGDILSGTCTFIDKLGEWRVINVSGRGGTSSSVIEAMVKVVVHGFSDIFTPRGIQPPFLGLGQLLGAKPGITLREGGDPVPVRDVVRYMYSNGYDLRHFLTMKISPAVADIILWSYHGIRACAAGSDPGEAAFSDRLKREQMQALTHGALACANILKTALYGWNPTAINLPQFTTFATRMLSLMKLAAERDRRLRQQLDDGWKDLLACARRL